MIRLLVFAVVGAFSLLFGSFHISENDTEKEKVIQDVLLRVLNQAHFDPADINDEFSKEVYTTFLEYVDGRKRFFTTADIDQLSVYELEIDDHVNTGSLEFFDLAVELLQFRIDQAEQFYQEVLEQPFDFNVTESYEFDPDKKEYTSNISELKERWRKALKYDVLVKLESKVNRQEEDSEVEQLSFEELEKQSREDVLKNYNRWYKNFKKVKRSDRFEAYLNSLAHAFDPHSDYFNPKEKQDFDINMGGKLEGIGARLRSEGDLTKVVFVVPGGPVWRNKTIEVNDYILKVKQKDEEPVDVFGMRLDDVVAMIRGDKGTFVTLTIKKKDETVIDVELERDVVNIEESFARSVKLDLPGTAENIGYIHLPKFYSSFEGEEGNSCAVDVAREIEKLKEDNVNGIILDLRNNGGGSLRDVVNMSGLFIEDGPIVQVKSPNRKPYVYKDEDEDVKYTGPLVVLVNSFSASASEILAAALQDYKRAVIVGSQSFGKGTVQRFIDLDRAVRGSSEHKPLGELKITMQKFYRINGGSTQLKGVSPDINLPDRYSKIDVGEREYPNSMAWSEIGGLDYDQDVFLVDDLTYIKKRSQDRVAQNDQFKLISEQAQVFKENRDKTEYSLNFKEFRNYLDDKDEESKRFDDLLKEDIEFLNVTNLESDFESINLDETTKARNEDWIKSIKKDIYIAESLSIISDLINGPSYVKRRDNLKN